MVNSTKMRGVLSNKGFTQQKMVKLSHQRQILQRLIECSGAEGSRWQGHLKLRRHYEERQRTTYQHSIFGSTNSLA